MRCGYLVSRPAVDPVRRWGSDSQQPGQQGEDVFDPAEDLGNGFHQGLTPPALFTTDAETKIRLE